MPFFRNTNMIEHNKNVTLQVRKSPNKKMYSPKRVWLSASLTVEAALVLPLFVFAAATLMLPMKMMDNQRKNRRLWNMCVKMPVNMRIFNISTKMARRAA